MFRPEFLRTVVFYGCTSKDLDLDDDVLEELAAWKTEHWTCVESNTKATVISGPYVAAKGRTWQPWKVYNDYNATFMCTFKPLLGQPGHYGEYEERHLPSHTS